MVEEDAWVIELVSSATVYVCKPSGDRSEVCHLL